MVQCSTKETKTKATKKKKYAQSAFTNMFIVHLLQIQSTHTLVLCCVAGHDAMLLVYNTPATKAAARTETYSETKLMPFIIMIVPTHTKIQHTCNSKQCGNE